MDAVFISARTPNATRWRHGHFVFPWHQGVTQCPTYWMRSKVIWVAWLQLNIPRICLGVIAHGEYCDEEFYLEKHIDFTQNVVDLCTNIEGSVVGSRGWKPKLIIWTHSLRKADTEFTWAPVSNKVLVMIGNANPHPPDYKLNMDIILTGG